MSAIIKNSRVLHHRFAILGTVKQVSRDGELLVKWDAKDGEDLWYTAEELIDVTGEGV